jgi:hypothetical protein
VESPDQWLDGPQFGDFLILNYAKSPRRNAGAFRVVDPIARIKSASGTY